ncbi:MAG: SURF1 family cytochrome oxidase biogenesis protein [Burkholderiaceae bacterium]
MAGDAQEAVLLEIGVVSLAGLVRVNEPGGGFLRANDPANERYSRDVVAMAQARGLAKASPFFVDAGLPGSSAASDGWPRQGLTVVRFSNNHLVYALTWFSLALMVAGAVGYVARSGRTSR